MFPLFPRFIIDMDWIRQGIIILIVLRSSLMENGLTIVPQWRNYVNRNLHVTCASILSEVVYSSPVHSKGYIKNIFIKYLFRLYILV